MRRGETVILAAGDFPRSGGEPRRLLEAARRVVCCDRAADRYRRAFGRDPDLVVGDGDSVRGRFANFVQISEQETNDLLKAIRLCAERGWKKPVILGAGGGREDHLLGNVFRGLEAGLEIVTETGRFVPFCGRLAMRLGKGTPVSVFAGDPATRITSQGLEWPLDKVAFNRVYSATLNRTSAARVVLVSDRPAYVYLPR